MGLRINSRCSVYRVFNKCLFFTHLLSTARGFVFEV